MGPNNTASTTHRDVAYNQGDRSQYSSVSKSSIPSSTDNRTD